MPRTSGRCRTIATAIEAYLQRHPGAADTDRGIAEWWLKQAGIEASRDELRAALAVLLEEGIVEVQFIVDGQAIYRANRQHGTEANG